MDIIVVEGTHDVSKIKSVYPDANCIITNGREISNETIDCIKELSKTNNIIIFTDPDSPGEKIRSIITEAVPNAKQAFLRKKDCISSNNKKVGIEHASKEAIKEALNNVYSNNSNIETITNQDLFKLGLNGNQNSAILREKISNYLNIGKPNCKTFLKRLNLLGLTYEKVEEIICKVK
ncbi:MAG: ribonuclease M5 [Erysipelotrichaceae bacterium]|nr:ribonuclease M5 [Erysipelotrichaceae bacterium]